jgi:hypothetical protein
MEINHMTKREYRAARADWTKALMDGRVIRVGDTFTSYPTIDARDKAIARLSYNGVPFTVVTA